MNKRGVFTPAYNPETCTVCGRPALYRSRIYGMEPIGACRAHRNICVATATQNAIQRDRRYKAAVAVKCEKRRSDKGWDGCFERAKEEW